MRIHIGVVVLIGSIVLLTFRQFAFAQDFRVSETSHAHFGPSLAADSTGTFVVVWSDGRNSIENGGQDTGTAIYGQRFAADGLPIGGNFRVSESALGGGHRVPSISMSKNGVFVVSWHGPSGSGVWRDADIYARRYNNNGTPSGPSFRVSDDSGTSAQIAAEVLVLDNGSFVITWFDRREGPLFSYAQFYDSTGAPRGVNFRVNANGAPGIAWLGGFEDGRFFFMWAGYLHIYGADGLPTSGIANIGKDVSAIGIGIGTDSLLVVWVSFPQYKIFIRFYNTHGVALSDSFKVRDDFNNPMGMMTAARSTSGEIIITWQDHRNDFPGVIGDGDIYAQRYNRWLAPIGTNFKVNHESEERSQRDPSTIFSLSNFITVWWEDQTPERCPPLPPDIVDPRGITPIIGTIQPFANPTPGQVLGWRTKRSKCPQPSQFALHQNYPNPFNSETTIPFDLPHDGFVDITVYDLLGRSVQRLVHHSFKAGRYRTTFNATGLSSGIYFYRFTTDQFTQSRGMILIK